MSFTPTPPDFCCDFAGFRVERPSIHPIPSTCHASYIFLMAIISLVAILSWRTLLDSTAIPAPPSFLLFHEFNLFSIFFVPRLFHHDRNVGKVNPRVKIMITGCPSSPPPI